MDHKQKPKLTAKGQQRTQAMIDAAIDCFLLNGYEKTSLDMIIQKSGGSRATLYRCFKNKEGLFSAVIKNLIDDIFLEVKNTSTAIDSVYLLLEHFGFLFINKLLEPKTMGLYRLVIAESIHIPALGQAFNQLAPENSYFYLAQELEKFDGIVYDFEQLQQISGLFTEMLKTNFFMKALITLDYHPSKEEIRQQCRLCALIIGDHILGKKEPFISSSM